MQQVSLVWLPFFACCLNARMFRCIDCSPLRLEDGLGTSSYFLLHMARWRRRLGGPGYCYKLIVRPPHFLLSVACVALPQCSAVTELLELLLLFLVYPCCCRHVLSCECGLALYRSCRRSGWAEWAGGSGIRRLLKGRVWPLGGAGALMCVLAGGFMFVGRGHVALLRGIGCVVEGFGALCVDWTA